MMNRTAIIGERNGRLGVTLAITTCLVIVCSVSTVADSSETSSELDAKLPVFQLRLDNNVSASMGQPLLNELSEWRWLFFRDRMVVISAIVALTSLALLTIALTIRMFKKRTLQTWLGIVGILAVWLAVILNWQSVSALANRYRLRGVLDQFEVVAHELRSSWPKRDGDRPSIGPFMAYPVHNPKTLILLKLPELNFSPISYSVIEGGEDVLRFELAGVERGGWLEWHAPGSQPSNFRSGLGDSYQLDRHLKLSDRWYLVRYQLR